MKNAPRLLRIWEMVKNHAHLVKQCLIFDIKREGVLQEIPSFEEEFYKLWIGREDTEFNMLCDIDILNERRRYRRKI